MKYDLSIDTQAFFPDKLDGIKWDDLHYPPNSTEIERAEIDKMVNEQIRGKKALDPSGHEFKDTYDCILDQKNVDRQIEIIKNSRRPGLLWFIRARRVEDKTSEQQENTMKCNKHDCTQIAITFHGVSTITHGYCARHRCCAECGSAIIECKCKDGHTERPEFIGYLMRLANKNDQLNEHGIDIPNFGKFKP